MDYSFHQWCIHSFGSVEAIGYRLKGGAGGAQNFLNRAFQCILSKLQSVGVDSYGYFLCKLY